MVLHPEKEAEAAPIFQKWELDFADRRPHHRRPSLPRHLAGRGSRRTCRSRTSATQAPEYDRPWVEPAAAAPLAGERRPARWTSPTRCCGCSARPTSLAALGLRAVRHLIQGNSLQRPGGDAGVIRVDGHPTKALAFTSDVTPRYCEADPYRGRQAGGGRMPGATSPRSAPSRSRRPTTSISATPSGPRSWASWSSAMRGIGEACRALDFPIVSGNVSLYNETNGRGILPTPTIGGVGLIPDWTQDGTHRLCGRRRGDPARRRADRLGHASRPVDLPARDPRPRGRRRRRRSISRTRRRVGDFVRVADPRAAWRRRCTTSPTAASRSALAEMAMASGIGATVNQLDGVDPIAAVLRRGPGPLPRHA